MRGYSVELKEKNDAADPLNMGVRLGRFCIRLKVPASEVAKACKVSRTAVYNWFSGVSTPAAHHEKVIEQFIARLKNK